MQQAARGRWSRAVVRCGRGEQSAWGAFRTDFYPTWDYEPIAETERKKK